MKRRIIKQGHNTLTITLPSAWAKRFNLKAGDELELSERDNGLFLGTERKSDHRTAEIDITGLDIPTIWKYFMAVYREGYDEVKVKFNPDSLYESPYKFFTTHAIDIRYGKKPQKLNAVETIQQITSRFIGFEVIEHHKDFCLIKDMLDSSSKEFDSSLRRVFLLIQQMGEEMLEAIKTNNVSLVCHTHDIDINVDKFHDYCVRVLNKTGFKEVRRSHLMFTTLYLLELIGDEFKNIAFHFMEDLKNKNLANLQQLAERVVEHFNQFYELFYKFDNQKVLEISNRDMNIYLYMPKIYKKDAGKKSSLSDSELEILNHFRRISRYLNALVELRVEMEF